MAKKRSTQRIVNFLVQHGYDADEALETAQDAIAENSPIVESICFEILAEQQMLPVHKTGWIKNRAKEPDCEDQQVIKRLLDSGASSKDLAIFARHVQRELLSNLAALLDGSGGYDAPSLPHKEFRVFAVDGKDRPIAMLEDIHESLEFQSLSHEMDQSRRASKPNEDGRTKP